MVSASASRPHSAWPRTSASPTSWRTAPDRRGPGRRAAADADTLRRLLGLAASGCTPEQPTARSRTPPWGGTALRRAGEHASARADADRPALWAAWGHLAHSVRTGENAFEALHGVDVWTHRGHPEQNAIFNDNMTALSSLVAAAVAAAYDFSGAVERRRRRRRPGRAAGGGARAARAPHRHGVRPARTWSPRHRRRERSSALRAGGGDAAASSTRCPAADGYLLKSILHDWPDDECVEILRTCRRGLDRGGVVLVVEMVLGRPGYEVEAAFSDLNMLVLPGGRERTEQEYAALFDAAGLRLTRSSTQTPGCRSSRPGSSGTASDSRVRTPRLLRAARRRARPTSTDHATPPPSQLDPADRGDGSRADGGGELPVVAGVLVGVGLGEVGDRLVELVVRPR